MCKGLGFMKKVSIIGLFMAGESISDGQSIKTRIVTDEIEKVEGFQNINRIDTYGWRKRPFNLLFSCFKAVWTSKNIVFMIDAGGIKIFPWLLSCANIFTRRAIHYVVIGGWLINFVKNHKLSAWFLKRLSGIYVETDVMKNAMQILGFKNVYVMPNFKVLEKLTANELVYSSSEPYKFCTFSRVMKEKGIENAVSTVSNINSLYGRTVCTLDIYGQVDSDQIDWFENLKLSFNDAVKYCGVVPFNETVDILKEYYALLFPTEFYTEGIPGTLIDAYAAGVPVIASAWESVYDIVESDITGIVYPFEESDGLQNSMITFIENPDRVFAMKENCLERSLRYSPDAVMDILISRLD